MKQFYILLVALLLATSVMAQWVPQNSGTNEDLYSVYFTDANTGYAGGNHGLLIKTIDGGITWDTLLFNTWPYLDFYSIYFTDDNTGYVGGHGMLKTIDAGTTWSYNENFTGVLNSVFFVNSYTGYTVGLEDIPNYHSYFYKTIDAGTTWTGQLFIDGEGFYSLFFTDVNTGYAVGTSIFKTIDGGVTWDTLLQLSSCFLTSVYFTDDNTGYAVGNNLNSGIIIKTIDAGTTWDTLLTTTASLESVCFTDVNTGYAVGYVGTILKTTDGGINWFTQSGGTPSSAYNSVYFPTTDTGYIAGYYGTILKTTNGGGYVGVNNQSSISNSLRIYPNPSSDKINIETSTEGHVYIQNLNGQELLNHHISKPSAQIDISGLPVGIYSIKLRNENTVLVGKIIKQ